MSWDGFTKSLETDGGKMVVVLFMLLFFCGAALLMALTKHVPQEAGRELMTAAISALLGILYGFLKSSGPRP